MISALWNNFTNFVICEKKEKPHYKMVMKANDLACNILINLQGNQEKTASSVSDVQVAIPEAFYTVSSVRSSFVRMAPAPKANPTNSASACGTTFVVVHFRRLIIQAKHLTKSIQIGGHLRWSSRG